ncbi:MAG: glucoamylase family protein, partial [bacterium]
QFLLTLDADSRLAACGARRLVAAALHPLNRPVLDAKRGRVLSGSGILQPRLSVALSSASATGFALLFAGQGGMDPYSGAVSELWQDLFGKSTFTGKGLMNVPLARRVLEGAFPENAILSHDILEGALLGCATEGRAEVTESFPGKVGSYYSRLDRWVRGDWQNIRFLGRKSPLTRLDRWKLFDNLRRSLVPVGELAALLACLIGGKALLPPALFTLAVLLAEFWETAAGELMRRDGTLRPRTSATLLHGPSGAGLRALASLLLLPQEAWVRLRAAATALFRMTVSRRYLLRWTTAAEAERGRADTLWGGFARYPALWLAGLAVLALGRYPFWGVGWLFAPALAVLLSRPLPQKSGLGGAERHFLLRRAEELWRFFEEQLTPEDHFLPPDNVSADSVAHRTSPTNIGFALTSCAAAEALGLTERAKATELMEEILATLEPLPKWRGHLPNWLDTRTLAPLAPVFYSAVDSGNLCAALLTAAGALESWGREESARRARRLAEETDFRALYDEKRGLLHIGYDPAKGERSESYYDLYASEARLTAYVAIALGQLPRRHWSRLSRALVGEGGYRGAVSWTGTMFEYLMPELFLPLVPNSFQWDSAAFAVRCQKKANHDLPWGISESAFWRAEGWGYRAHGVRQLALSRGEKQDRVIAPYATYLALPIAGGEAVENLRGLWEAGYRGVYGLYEAVDYTEEGEARPVPIFMAHHVGMSLAAAANALTKNALKEFFLRDARMFAWQELLSERVPISEPLMGKLPPAVRAARPAERRAFEERPAVLDALEPMLLPLRAGDFRLWVLENGKTKALFGDTLLCRWEPGARGAGGMALTLEAEGETLPLTPWPQYRRDCTYETALRPGEAVFRMRRGGVEALLTIRVSPEGEERVVTVRGLSGEAFLSANLEPALTRERDYSAHPPFHRLTLRYSLVRGGLLMERRGGVSAVLSLEGARYATEGDALLHYTPTPLITARAPIRNGQPLRVTLTRAGQFAPSPVPTLTAAAEKLRLDAESVRAALLLTSRLQTLPRREKERFWPCGISGDRPILAALCAGGEGLRRLRGLLGIHALLWDCGVPTDLALLLTDGGDYLALQRGEAERWLREREREANGSIHFLDSSEARETMEAGANLLIDLAAPWSPPKRENRLPLPQLPQTRARRVPWKYLPDGSFTFEG